MREKVPSAAPERVVEGLSVLCISTFSKEAEMMMLRKMGICMALLLLLLFVVMEVGRKRAAGRSNKNLLVDFSCFGSHGHIISALQEDQITPLCGLGLVPAVTYFSKFPVNITDWNWGGN